MAIYNIEYLIENGIITTHEAELQDDPLLKAFNEFISQVDEYANSSYDLLQEKVSGIEMAWDNFKGSFDSCRKQVLEKYYKLAQEANDYADSVMDLTYKMKNKIKGYIEGEYTQYSYMCGNTIVTVTTHYDAVYLDTVLPFSTYSGMDEEELKKEYKKLLKKYGDVLSRAPEIVAVLKKGTTDDCAQYLVNMINQYKKFLKSYLDEINKMEKALNDGVKIVQEIKNSGEKKRIKCFNRLVSMQKRIYVHDTNLLRTAAQAVLKQSESLRKFVKKNKVLK